MAINAGRWIICGGIAGLVISLLGTIIGWVVLPKIVRSKIAQILPLRPETESWERWKELPVPIQYRVFIFKVNNPEEILRGEPPNVTETGPYVYTEKRNKANISVNERDSKVVYDHKLTFEFDALSSAPLTEEDVITVVNAPAVLFGLVVDNLKVIDPVIKLYNTAVNKMWPTPDLNPLFVKAKVRDLLFDGLPIYCNQSKSLDNMDTAILCRALRIIHPKTVTLDDSAEDVHSFAVLKYKNDKSDGIYEIDLGINDVTKIGQILSWNNRTSLSIWKGESCNRIVGTDATVFRPYLEEDNVQSLSIYHTDVCRSVQLAYERDTEFKGVKGRRYTPDSSFFGSVLENSDTHCYCPQSVKGITHYGGCMKSGVLEISGCQGAPVVVSYPHFLMADESYQGKVIGLNPDVEKHQTLLDLEPPVIEIECCRSYDWVLPGKSNLAFRFLRNGALLVFGGSVYDNPSSFLPTGIPSPFHHVCSHLFAAPNSEQIPGLHTNNTGYPLRAASRVQINTFLKSIPSVRVMQKLPNVLIPLLWLEEKMELTDELIDTINSQLLNNLKILDIVKWVAVGCGIALVVGALLLKVVITY